MPKSAPKVPTKPSGLKILSTPNPLKCDRTTCDGLRAPKANPRPKPRVRVRGTAGDDNEEAQEADREQQETREGRYGDDVGSKDGDGDGEKKEEQDRDGPLPPLPGPPLDEEAKRKARKKANQHPQKTINLLWKNYEPAYMGRVTKILPESLPESTIPKGIVQKSQNASQSYEEARAQCEKDVQRIINECRILNQKYTDTHFDIEQDLKVTSKRDCLDGLIIDEEERYWPEDVKRVTDLFKAPKFYSEGAGFDDIMQGAIGDCWMMSAFSVLTCNEELVRKVCVIQDQEVGVYGFVFFRDGEWHQTIIDDKLYLNRGAYDEGIETVLSTWGREQEKKYNELFQQGSKALYFARCRDDNETWVPLLEKALAKAHGGYDALSGGQTGEALEDLTGGVTTELYTTNILSKEKFWANELNKIGRDFMFDATDAVYREWRGWDEGDSWVKKMRDKARKGVVDRHAYAVLGTYEGYGERLVKVRNPWGQAEWTGAWSDGSSEWTAEWLQRLGHKFGDDGIFWMSYEDFLKNYKHLNRTRIFDDSWYTAQKWATLQVPFSTMDYQATKFEINISDDTDTVIVLSQLDDRYFQGLQGKYEFRLQFRVSEAAKEDEYICRSKQNYELNRSTNVELFLRKGKYIVLIKVEALDRSYWGWKTPDDVIKDNLPRRKEKVTTIGRLYDLAHRKGLPEAEEETPPTSEDVGTDAGTQTTDEGTGTNTTVVTPATTATAESTAAPTKTDSETTPAPVPTSLALMVPAVVAEAKKAEDSDDEDDEDEDEDEKQPWNASCVVGLRVYSKQPEVTVRVILPPKPKVEESVLIPALDRDDITKSSQDKAEDAEKEAKEGSKEEKKKSEKPKEEEEKGKKIEYDGVMSKPRGALPSRGKGAPVVEKAQEADEEDDEEEEEEEEDEDSDDVPAATKRGKV